MSPVFDPVLAAGKLLELLGCSTPESVTPLPGGRNNQVWRVCCEGQPFLLKHYFWSKEDPRDRMGHEWAFLGYLREIGCKTAPAPLARLPADRCALLEFVEGSPLDAGDIAADEVAAAADFFLQINEGRVRGEFLPPVSEACLSIEEHIGTTEGRVARLDAIEPLDGTYTEVRDFVKNTVRPLWLSIGQHIRSCAGADFSRILKREERCLSPSDFGFHNALREVGGNLRFLDFEYAGWDDPAKTIVDFCNQPDLLLPARLASVFRVRAVGAFVRPDDLDRRVALLEPLYQLKWACICLNGFLPGRGFPDPRPDRSPQAQLERARIMAFRAAENLDSFPGNS